MSRLFGWFSSNTGGVSNGNGNGDVGSGVGGNDYNANLSDTNAPNEANHTSHDSKQSYLSNNGDGHGGEDDNNEGIVGAASENFKTKNDAFSDEEDQLGAEATVSNGGASQSLSELLKAQEEGEKCGIASKIDEERSEDLSDEMFVGDEDDSTGDIENHLDTGDVESTGEVDLGNGVNVAKDDPVSDENTLISRLEMEEIQGPSTSVCESSQVCISPSPNNEITNMLKKDIGTEEIDDSYPRAQDFLDDDVIAKAKGLSRGDSDLNDSDAITLAEQSQIVLGFNDEDDDGECNDTENGNQNNISFNKANNLNTDHDDARTVATQRTARSVRSTATNKTTRSTRVQPVSTAFRLAAQEEEKKKMHHPHQAIFDILDRNLEEEVGDGSALGVLDDIGRGNGSGLDSGISGLRMIRGKLRRLNHDDVKLCFVAFVAVFSLPVEPIFAGENGWDSIQSTESEGNDDHYDDSDEEGVGHESSNDRIHKANSSKKKKERVRPKVPLSVAHALWMEVLQIENRGKSGADNENILSYIRNVLILLGFLEMGTIEREDMPTPGQGGFQSQIECVSVHHDIHQQYGEYVAWGDHDASLRSEIQSHEQTWNQAVVDAAVKSGSNKYTLCMLPLNTMRANQMQDSFDLLREKVFVRRRIRVLGASDAAKAHVGDVDELLRLIEKRIEEDDAVEPIDEQECVLSAYLQVKKYCIHMSNDYLKHMNDTESHGESKDSPILTLSASAKVADIGNALHLLGASLGGYGFFEEEMNYYGEALRLKDITCRNGNDEYSVSASDTLHCMGFSLDNAGKSDEALEYYDKALDLRLDFLGENDLRVAETYHNKGALLCEAGRSEESMECLEEALRIRELHYGEEHESCADTMQWMGNLLRKHGDPSDALDYFKFALRIKQTRLGNNDIDVANTLFNTAVLLDDLEKYELSLIAYKECLRIRKLVLGENSQEVANTLFCMGNVTTVMEHHEEALTFFKESIEIREFLIKEDDPSASLSADNSFLFLSHPTSTRPDLVAQYQKLNQCFEEALPLTKLLVGSGHADVSSCLNRMGEVYLKLQDWDNAIGSFQGCLRVKRADLPDGDDIEVATLLYKKGEAHVYKKEFSRAKSTFNSTLQIREKLLGRESLPVASALYCLGVACHYLNDFSHATIFFQECMKIQVKLMGENDGLVAKSLCWLGRQHEKLNDTNKALEKYLTALRMYKRDGSLTDYRVVIMLLHSIGRMYEDGKVNLHDMSLKCYTEEIKLIHSKLDLEEADNVQLLADAHFCAGLLCKRRREVDQSIEHLEQALELTSEDIGEKIKIATISDNLGMLFASKEELSLAKKHFSTAFSVYEKTIGSDNLKTSDCAFRLGVVLESLSSDLSSEFYKESLRVQRLHGNDEEKVAEILFCLGRVYLKKAAYKDSTKCFEEALSLRKKLLGECAQVADTYHYLGNAYFQSNQCEKALIFYRESVRINKKLSEKNALHRATFDMAQCCEKIRNYQLAIECYNDCLRGTESLGDDNINVPLVMRRIGHIQMYELQNYHDAAKMLLDSLELLRGKEETDDENNLSLISLVFQIAQAYALSKEYETALDYYEEHVNLIESDPEGSEDLVADSLFEMGNIFAHMAKTPDYELSIEKLNECLEIKKKLHGPDEEQVAKVVYTLGTVYEKAGQTEKCVDSLTEALRTFKMKRNKVESAKIYHHLARLKSEASKTGSSADHAAAVECFEEAIKMRRQLMLLDDIELASMLYDYAKLLCSDKKYKTAMPMLEEAMQIQKSKSGLKDARAAKILIMMAEVYTDKGKINESFSCLEQVIFIHNSLGEDCDIDMGSCYYLLGCAYISKDNSEKAIAYLLRSMEIKKEQFGHSSLECSNIFNHLGVAYGKRREFDKAIESLVEALRIRKIELGNDSLDYGHSVFNLAQIHAAMEKHSQSLNCLNETVRVYEMFEEEVGVPKMLEVMEMKGDTLYLLDQYEDSISSFQKCFELICDCTGAKDELIGSLYYKMGKSLSKLSDYDEAFDCYRQSIRIFKDVLGPDHLRVADVMYDVGVLVYARGADGAFQQSMECLTEAVRIYNLQGEGNHKSVADALLQIGTMHADKSEYDEAMQILEKALELFEEMSQENPCVTGKALTLQQIGRIHEARGAYEESMAAFNKALEIFESLGGNELNVAFALSNIGIIHARRSEYAEAVEKCRKAVKIRKINGGNDQDVAESLFKIGNILVEWGKEDEAMAYFNLSLDLFKKNLGKSDISVANCLVEIARIHLLNKDTETSLSRFHEAFDACERSDDADLLLASIYKGIGECYFHMDERDLALENFAECLKIQRAEGGDDCIDMASTCECIGSLYQKEEKYLEAINFFERALSINDQHHGKDSRECANSHFQLAKIFIALEKYNEAANHLKEGLQTYNDETQESEVADAYHNLGIAQNKLIEYEESMDSLNKALEMRIKLLGKFDRKVADTMIDLGRVLEEWGDADEAITMYDQAITVFQKSNVESDFRTIADTYLRVGELLQDKDKYVASLHSYKKALKIYNTIFGGDAIEVGRTVQHIGEIYNQLGDYDKSTGCFTEAIQIFRLKLGNDDICVSQALDFLGTNYARKKQFSKAVELFTESVRIQKKVFGENKQGEIADSLFNIGNMLNEWGKEEQALQFYEEAQRVYEEAAGSDSIEVASCQQNIGILRKKLNDPEAALLCFGKALQTHRHLEGDKSLNVASDLYHIGQLYDSFGFKEKSLQCFQECLKIRKDKLGEDNLDVLAAERFIGTLRRKLKY